MNSFSNLNLSIPDMWEVRDVVNKLKNVVLNYTEMEAKVHEATNNEAWGASSTLMQEIAQATVNYQYFNEIMPIIYKRFSEKEAKQWRQIYKSLVLLEYLIKNGSERVVDDARSHISTIKMMKNFHYIDDKGKDQGINVRNRAKEMAELLNDVEAIKEERKKAKKNRSKYIGVGSDIGMSFGSRGGSSGRYDGFGSDSNYSSGGGYGGSSSGGYGGGAYDNHSNDFYEDESRSRYDDFDSVDRRNSSKSEASLSPPQQRRVSGEKKAAHQQPKTAKEMNLFDFDEPTAVVDNKKQANNNSNDWGDFANSDDDFDDFQSASTAEATTTPAKSTHSAAPKKTNNLFDLLDDNNSTSSSPVPPHQQHQNLMLAQGMSFETIVANSPHVTNSPIMQPTSAIPSLANSNNTSTTNNNTNNSTNASSKPMGGIWSQASGLINMDSLGKSNTAPAKAAQGPSMNAMKNNSVNASWSTWAMANPSPTAQSQQQQQKPQQQQSSVFDDLLS